MAISLITDQNAIASSHALVRAIAKLCRRVWSLEFTWVPRQTNRPVDSLAKHVPPDDLCLLMFDQPPCYTADLLYRDVHGPPYCKARTG
ncbi:hypothetical protein V6N13_012072 [Hibiscus sabdariffa]|uniref:RNase H type-1 domain-containing protein n=1 Tax=Hibiscus sabdariffa TaxID=183260 RepID=A0ABR2SDZ6_9ROSI